MFTGKHPRPRDEGVLESTLKKGQACLGAGYLGEVGSFLRLGRVWSARDLSFDKRGCSYPRPRFRMSRTVFFFVIPGVLETIVHGKSSIGVNYNDQFSSIKCGGATTTWPHGGEWFLPFGMAVTKEKGGGWSTN